MSYLVLNKAYNHRRKAKLILKMRKIIKSLLMNQTKKKRVVQVAAVMMKQRNYQKKISSRLRI